MQKIFLFSYSSSFLCLSADNFPYSFESQEADTALSKLEGWKKNKVSSKELAKSSKVLFDSHPEMGKGCIEHTSCLL